MIRQQMPRTRLASIFTAILCISCLEVSAQPDVASGITTRSTDLLLAEQLTSDQVQLLDAIQRGCFNYLWLEVGSPAELVKDCRNASCASVAGVGFQLSALPIGVERGWISRAEGEQRAVRVLESLTERTDNRRRGVYLHFVDQNTGGLDPAAPEVQASTIDHALLVAGAVPAAVYFGGRTAELVDVLISEADWQAYVTDERNRICFGWRPLDPSSLDGPGSFRPWDWQWASDEERLVYFLAVAAPQQHAVPPRMYYELDRRVMRYRDLPEFVASWNGALFTYFFSHCWINYRQYGADNPSAFGVAAPPVDWFENSRRATLAHRERCHDVASDWTTLRDGRWGLSPCNGFAEDGSPSYLVPSIRPNIVNDENLCGGTVAPYAAGTAIMFTPRESISALEALRMLADAPWAGWDDPAAGGFGLPDSFQCDLQKASHNALAIDAGPMLIGIENFRTGLIWRLFHEHAMVARGVERLDWRLRAEVKDES
ncbi:MAG: glucoamylase family protein [Planctomycetota bacterium]